MDIEKLKELVNKGYSTHKIAKEIGFSQSHVSRILRKNGIKTHPYKEKGNCLNCKVKLKKKSQKKYCSANCQQEHRFKIQKENIENETSTRVLKKYLVDLDNKCSICSMPAEWEFKSIVMILDHIDGNSENNNLDNLRLVCPNCDSQLPTFKGRNTGNGRYYRRQRYKAGRSY